MTTHREIRDIAVPREVIFDLVADVERYPEFLPLWTEARIFRHRGADIYYTEQEVGLGPVRQRFHTRTTLVRPAHIDVPSNDPSFRTFHIGWDFAERPGGCRVRIGLSWKVHSWLMQRAIDLLLPETAKSMVDAFERRARQAMTNAGRTS